MRSGAPEAAPAPVKLSEMCDIGGMVPAIPKILDAFSEMFAGLKMAGGMPITLGPAVNE